MSSLPESAGRMRTICLRLVQLWPFVEGKEETIMADIYGTSGGDSLNGTPGTILLIGWVGMTRSVAVQATILTESLI